MKNQTKKFLKFNGKSLYFLAIDGQWWIAIKPICEALAVNYNRQFQNLKSDQILSQLFAEQQIVAADNRLRKMVCLPERFIYGWLFSIKSNSEMLRQYKLECYEVLYSHFHGSILEREELLAIKTKAKLKMDHIKKEFLDTDVYQRFLQAEQEMKNAMGALRSMDNEIVVAQLPIWEQQL